MKFVKTNRINGDRMEWTQAKQGARSGGNSAPHLQNLPMTRAEACEFEGMLRFGQPRLISPMNEYTVEE